ncbi:UDP-N-acetylglucosamine 1-carboxyvinyltransferase [Campylobacter hyointestinalis]|uniref:UDP-N-acetylglucosamine 1-carboxyvinyltransferase n=1 Tax=Campylobacter hyointestinalis TaxID=198 RepID=UPI0004D9211D|nr:UDP-N-acetylglucosamine 1-carboxyvinyltransferase [Campylobacter hyointestinalis]ANE32604.1 UDP-N-acetylglucosamine enolpyruvoyl transferase [Campylobacter hyointestinalis subsp. hyointestinalis LMG 9260]KEA45054.1 UDP-N-acetylglucosamine 1-carboxyvinyltransferase [Campylobacter hyointestinalis subsp. hyointestinalis]MBT0612713.1 UDP-N-acetylglucosamine 1-carboxyvinyltransferase [Campylobacter hyointestinalis subsp. hyointestinalis]MDY2998979.1 UDP-N-acetylglucosamine 1-carboxyvinyltransfera
MDYLEIKGGNRLSGKVDISGAKNAALPLIAMSILGKNNTEFSNIPRVADTQTLVKLLVNLGANAKFDDSNLVINTSTINSTKATYDIVRKMRASILVLGPLLTRFGHCEVSLPGGCAIGARPIDLHLSALEKMGANIEIKDGYVVAKATGGLKGANIVFDKITVTGTENIVMAAALAKGKTTILNAAKEPEVVQVCQILNDSGIKIEGIGTSELIIHGNGGELLNLAKICVIPDRIEAGTYLCACAISGGEITLNGVEPSHLVSVLDKLSDMGVRFELEKNSIKVISDAKLAPVNIITTEFPGFPTDMQAQFMALAAVADGVSTIDERLFENRFMHASELSRMGADIKLNGHIATISGSSLNGADVMATDLRASSALVLAALRANGITRVHRIYHLDRGYENLEKKLQNLGADIKRLSE